MKKAIILFTFIITIFLTACESTGDLDDVVISNIDAIDTSEDLTTEEIDDALESIVTETTLKTITFEETYTDYLFETYFDLLPSNETYEISVEGVYVLSGTYEETIVINVHEEDDVTLVLNNVNITSSSGPAILVLSADDVTISLPEGTFNTLTDSPNYPVDDEGNDYNATIYSNADLLFNGLGELNITCNFNNAINSKDDIKIVESSININSVDDGIIGRDSISISNAEVSITSGGDSLLSTNNESTEKGFIYIDSGIFTLNSGTDAIQAVNIIVINGGTFDINADDMGVCSEQSIYIGNGVFDIISYDDAINSNDTITIYDGEITISTSEDGINAENEILIEGGTINVLQSYEGIESYTIIINGGTINITSSDDAINATAGGGQMHGSGYISTGGFLFINGGIIQVNSIGDGIDVNGSIEINGGYVFVFGASTDTQSSIDYDNTLNINGGLVLALGSSGMAQNASTTSTQSTFLIAETTTYQSGTIITISDENNEEIISVESIKSFAAILFSSEELTVGQTYNVEIGDNTIEVNLSSNITLVGTIGEGGMKPPGRR